MKKNVSMRVKAWGTRGSIAISNPDSVQAGGNTTCYEIMSPCLPEGMRLCLDAGTGFVPMGWNYIDQVGNGLHYLVLYTHYHYDHIVGLTLAPPTFIPIVPMTMVGPVDNGVGPEKMIEHLFKRPFFPVDAKQIKHKMKFHSLENFDVTVMAIHPIGGLSIHHLDKFIKASQSPKKQLSFGKGTFPIDECLIIKMQSTHHGDQRCISYRVEERPTGRIFVLATDHENQESPPIAFRNHLEGAHLVIIDAQYDEKRYITQTGGYGHGTPEGIVKLGLICGSAKMGITHHDPRSVDAFLRDMILPEAHKALTRLQADKAFLEKFNVQEVQLTDVKNVFLCYDYAEYDV